MMPGPSSACPPCSAAASSHQAVGRGQNRLTEYPRGDQESNFSRVAPGLGAGGGGEETVPDPDAGICVFTTSACHEPGTYRVLIGTPSIAAPFRLLLLKECDT